MRIGIEIEDGKVERIYDTESGSDFDLRQILSPFEASIQNHGPATVTLTFFLEGFNGSTDPERWKDLVSTLEYDGILIDE